MDAQVMGQGVEVMVFGLAGVFAVLILFYVATKVMLGVSRKKPNKEE